MVPPHSFHNGLDLHSQYNRTAMAYQNAQARLASHQANRYASRQTSQQTATRHMQQSSAFSRHAHDGENWTLIPELQHRRRVQNRIAQRIYRERRKWRGIVENFERRYRASGSQADLISLNEARETLARVSEAKDAAALSSASSRSPGSSSSEYSPVLNQPTSVMSQPPPVLNQVSTIQMNSWPAFTTGGYQDTVYQGQLSDGAPDPFSWFNWPQMGHK